MGLMEINYVLDHFLPRQPISYFKQAQLMTSVPVSTCRVTNNPTSWWLKAVGIYHCPKGTWGFSTSQPGSLSWLQEAAGGWAHSLLVLAELLNSSGGHLATDWIRTASGGTGFPYPSVSLGFFTWMQQASEVEGGNLGETYKDS